jgi:hypothetical protein
MMRFLRHFACTYWWAHATEPRLKRSASAQLVTSTSSLRRSLSRIISKEAESKATSVLCKRCRNLDFRIDGQIAHLKTFISRHSLSKIYPAVSPILLLNCFGNPSKLHTATLPVEDLLYGTKPSNCQLCNFLKHVLQVCAVQDSDCRDCWLCSAP